MKNPFAFNRRTKEVWIRIPHWMYCLRYLLPINYKITRHPPHALYLHLESWSASGRKMWSKYHPIGLPIHIELVSWFWEN